MKQFCCAPILVVRLPFSVCPSVNAAVKVPLGILYSGFFVVLRTPKLQEYLDVEYVLLFDIPVGTLCTERTNCSDRGWTSASMNADS